MHLAVTLLASTLLLPSGLLGPASRFASATPGGKNCEPCGLEKWMQDEEAVAFQGVLNNIGCHSRKVKGAGCGIVVASPSKRDPDYFYTWTRDSALTMQMIIDECIFGNKTLEPYIEDYIKSQAIIQTVSSPAGTLLPEGLGLGEPKFDVDSTKFNGPWGRPQRDGPALRAIALITYSKYLVEEKGQRDKAKRIIWPIIQNDISYVGQYWNQTGFDLWEEVLGSSFFTIQNQHRALIEAEQLASMLDEKCTGCDQAPNLLQMLQYFWNKEYIDSNINVDEKRSGLDGNTIVGPISVFDIEANCKGSTFQPCNSKTLANFKKVVDVFRKEYAINKGAKPGQGIAIGRYTEDTYQGGHPWYLLTFGAAELLYDAIAQWEYQKVIHIDATSLPFFRELYPLCTTGTFPARGGKYGHFAKIARAVRDYADSFVKVAMEYTPEDGSLAEQYGRDDGKPVSARDLTWSYASFITMMRRREGAYPRSWNSSSAYLPDQGESNGMKSGSRHRHHRDHHRDHHHGKGSGKQPIDDEPSDRSPDADDEASMDDDTKSGSSHHHHHRKQPRHHGSGSAKQPVDDEPSDRSPDVDDETSKDDGSKRGRSYHRHHKHYSSGSGRQPTDDEPSDEDEESSMDDGSKGGYPALWTQGVYAPATAAGAPDLTGPCQVKVRFEVAAATYFGENIYVIGSTPALGNWDISNAMPLDSSEYTAENPLWRGTVFLDAARKGTRNEVKYHYLRQQDDKWVKETVERKVEVGSCGSRVVETDDSWTGPIVASKNSGGIGSGILGSGILGFGYGADGKTDKTAECPKVVECSAPNKEDKASMSICLMPDGVPITKHALQDMTNKIKHPAKQHPFNPLKPMQSHKGLKKRLECLVE